MMNVVIIVVYTRAEFERHNLLIGLCAKQYAATYISLGLNIYDYEMQWKHFSGLFMKSRVKLIILVNYYIDEITQI